MNRALGMLGLSARAGKLQSGEQACDALIKRGAAQLVLVDGGASGGTRKAFIDACAHYHVPICFTGKDELGSAIGKPGRRVAVITDVQLALQLTKLLSAETSAYYNNDRSTRGCM